MKKQKINMTKEQKDLIYQYYIKKFDSENFLKDLEIYCNVEPFEPHINLWESGQSMTPGAHYIMRIYVQLLLSEAFTAMKIDLRDENVKECAESGNIGTPGRIAKMWCGANLEDNSEMLSGRWIKEPRMASFQRDEEPNQTPVWIETQIRAVCSHHFIGFQNNPNDKDSFVVVGYIPEKGIKGGLSKISRFVRDYASRRPWLQEDLCTYVGIKIKEKFKSESVYVAMHKINHGCTWTRGANDQDAGTTTTFISGKFAENPNLIPEKYRA